jgi:hypothetical protein
MSSYEYVLFERVCSQHFLLMVLASLFTWRFRRQSFSCPVDIGCSSPLIWRQVYIYCSWVLRPDALGAPRLCSVRASFLPDDGCIIPLDMALDRWDCEVQEFDQYENIMDLGG